MRILTIITDLEIGGAERQVLAVRERLKERGHEVLVVTMKTVTDKHFLKDVSLEVATLGMRRDVRDIGGFFKLLKTVDEFKPDIITGEMFHGSVCARAVRLFRPAPAVITTSHNTYEGGLHRDLLLKLTDSLVDCQAYVLNDGLKQGFSKPKKSVVIQNRTDPDQLLALLPQRETFRAKLGFDGFVWLAVGRLHKQKNFAGLLAEFKKLEAVAKQKTALMVLGEGKELPVLQQLVNEFHLQSAVHFLGARPNVSEYYVAADAFVLSSSWEGLPLVVLEAASAKLPVVATNAGGVAEVIKDTSMGFLVSTDLLGLAEAMAAVMTMEESARKELGERLFEHVRQHFSIQESVEAWENLYCRLIAERKKKRLIP